MNIAEPFDIAIMVYSEELANIPTSALDEQVQRQLKAAKII